MIYWIDYQIDFEDKNEKNATLTCRIYIQGLGWDYEDLPYPSKLLVVVNLQWCDVSTLSSILCGLKNSKLNDFDNHDNNWSP